VRYKHRAIRSSALEINTAKNARTQKLRRENQHNRETAENKLERAYYRASDPLNYSLRHLYHLT